MLTIHLLVLAQLKTSAKQPVVWFGIGRSMMTRFSMQVIQLDSKEVDLTRHLMRRNSRTLLLLLKVQKLMLLNLV